jgi:hypothetical protein
MNPVALVRSLILTLFTFAQHQLLGLMSAWQGMNMLVMIPVVAKRNRTCTPKAYLTHIQRLR